MIYDGLKKIIKTVGPCVCTLCFKNKSKPLFNCIFATNDSYNASNLSRHITKKHKEDECPAFFRDETDKLMQKIEKEGCGTITAPKKGPLDNHFPKKDEPQEEEQDKQDPDDVYNEWARKAHTFFNKNGIAARAACSQVFKEFVLFTVNNAEILKHFPDKLFLGYERYTAISKLKFQELTYVVHKLLKRSNDYFIEKCRKQIPRVSVSHDIWESKNGHWLGITLFLMDVDQWKYVALPIGFKSCTSKKAIDIVSQVQDTLKRYDLLLFYLYYLTIYQTTNQVFMKIQY